MLTQFPKTKIKTPTEWLAEYREHYERQAKRSIATGLLMAVVVTVISALMLRHAGMNPMAAGDSLLLVFLVSLIGALILLLPSRPRLGDGLTTRTVLDASRRHKDKVAR